MPESLMPEFIRSIHGSFTSKDALIAQFLEKYAIVMEKNIHFPES
jgi:hypothetical protein